MDIKILGGGCAKCDQLEKNTILALKELNIEASITKIEDITKILEYGIMITPGLVVNEKVILRGRIATVNEIINLLKPE